MADAEKQCQAALYSTPKCKAKLWLIEKTMVCLGYNDRCSLLVSTTQTIVWLNIKRWSDLSHFEAKFNKRIQKDILCFVKFMLQSLQNLVPILS